MQYHIKNIEGIHKSLTEIEQGAKTPFSSGCTTILKMHLYAFKIELNFIYACFEGFVNTSGLSTLQLNETISTLEKCMNITSKNSVVNEDESYGVVRHMNL